MTAARQEVELSDLPSFVDGAMDDGRAALKPLVDAMLKGIRDPFERARILHDWTALNLSYDWPAFLGNHIPPQTPAVKEYYDRAKYWPQASLERRAVLLAAKPGK